MGTDFGDELDEIRESLGLDRLAFSALRSWVGEAMENGDYGWPNVFLSLGAVRDFGHRFLGAVKNRRLVGLSLVEDVAREFLHYEAHQEGHSGPGIWTALSRTRPLKLLAPPIGFDILGVEYDGWLHTFTCNGLERDYSQRLGIAFNRYGLIDDYAMALAACEYTNREDAGAELVGWYPFRLDEYETNETG